MSSLRAVFSDTYFWRALLYEEDDDHDKAKSVSELIVREKVKIVTSELVWCEVLNFMSKNFSNKEQASNYYETQIKNSGIVMCVPLQDVDFTESLKLYADHKQIKAGLVDCSSVLIMREFSLSEALTNDSDFSDLGMRALMKLGVDEIENILQSL